ncbi:hypothetical protein HTT03_08015 [Sulfitobacter sp. S0837]|uniref:hypothetical protein n=1 Tax=Sulfitobacter TaxID=60136 RepID=UPI001582E4E1|nr:MULTISPECIES: hypothetical protein [Sulfitobacter]NUH65234.1 hypothetical protein [Sulfitobacter maritimus]GLO79992.1 hypothetical protein MACH23_34130 [Sulfitobacter pontiacus]
MSQSNEPSRQPTELDVFLGEWRAEGTSYGGTDQSGDDPKANGEKWESEHKAWWHTGGFFQIEDECARPGGAVFDTHWVRGIDPETGRMFANSFENHGHMRTYELKRDGDNWTLSGPTERATINFSDNNRRQEIVWEWKPENEWLPLCDRTAVRVD